MPDAAAEMTPDLEEDRVFNEVLMDIKNIDGIRQLRM